MGCSISVFTEKHNKKTLAWEICKLKIHDARNYYFFTVLAGVCGPEINQQFECRGLPPDCSKEVKFEFEDRLRFGIGHSSSYLGLGDVPQIEDLNSYIWKDYMMPEVREALFLSIGKGTPNWDLLFKPLPELGPNWRSQVVDVELLVPCRVLFPEYLDSWVPILKKGYRILYVFED